MKLSATKKTIVVQFKLDDVYEFEIDNDVFDDPYEEAATRAVEQGKNKRGSIISHVTKCWDKSNPKKNALYNTYWILINAACYAKAELLREKFKAQHNIDLAKEPKYSTIKIVKK